MWFRRMKWREIGVQFYKKTRGGILVHYKIILKQPPTQERCLKNSTLVLNELNTRFCDFLIRLLARPWRIHVVIVLENCIT